VPLDARNAALRTAETNAGNLITDAMRARLHADVAVMNGGGIRGNQIVPAGPLSKRDINTLLPFLNVVVMLEIPGQVLVEVLERSVGVYPREFGGFLQVSGIAFFFDPTRPPGQRVVRVLVNGEPLVIAEMEAEIPTLSVGEAVMRLDLGNAPALMFRNAGNGGLNMIYRRADGNIGWVDPAAHKGKLG